MGYDSFQASPYADDMKTQLLYPVAFYVFYIFCLAIYMFRVRVRALKKREVAYKYFQTYSGESPQEKTLVVGRHFDNQFQVPMLFFLVSTLAIAFDKGSVLTVVLAWLFVLTRLVHSYVHLGTNHLTKRVVAYSAGWLALLFMLGVLVIDLI